MGSENGEWRGGEGVPGKPLRVRCRELAGRLRAVRVERFGDGGLPELARRLDLPARTWHNYESGVTVPGDVLLRFLVITAVEPGWLLDGRGPKYRAVT
jgi:hypothetical protein